jgi:hypothetical protein
LPTQQSENEHARVFVNGKEETPIKKTKLPPGVGWAVVRKKQREAAKK